MDKKTGLDGAEILDLYVRHDGVWRVTGFIMDPAACLERICGPHGEEIEGPREQHIEIIGCHNSHEFTKVGTLRPEKDK